MKRILFILFLSISVSAIGQDFWTQMNGPYGAASTDMVIHPASGALITSTSGAGLWRSTDQGVTWAKVGIASDVFFSDLDVDPSGNIYASTSNATKIYKSTDGGATFTLLYSGNVGAIGKIRAATSIKLYFSIGSSAIYKSTDSGATFNLTSTDIANTITDIDTSPLNTEHVIVSTFGGGVKISEDGGFSFNSLTISGSMLSNETVYNTIITSAGVAYSLTSTGPHRRTVTSGANSWVSVKGTISETLFQGRIAFNSDNSSIYLLNTASQKFYSATTAASPTWSAGTTTPNSLLTTGLIIQSATSYIAAGQFIGPYASTDSGTSWNLSTGTMKALSIRSFFRTPQNRLFAVVNGVGYLQSIDNGQTWTAQAAAPVNATISGFVTLPSDGSVLAWGPSGTFRSTGTIGNTWTTQSATGINQIVTYDGSNLFAFSGLTLLKSTNLGVTWTPLTVTGIPTSIAEIGVDASNTLYIRTIANLVYSLPNNGTTATQVTSGSDLSVYTDGTNSYVATLVNSNTFSINVNNAGFQFRSLPSGQNLSNIFIFRNGTIAAGSSINSNFYISTDYGVTWQANPLTETTARTADVTLNGSEAPMVATSFSTGYIGSRTIVLPTAPTNLTVLGNISTTGVLQWNDNANNNEMTLIEYSDGNNTSYQEYSTGFFDQNGIQSKGVATIVVIPGATRYFRVAAKNAAGVSSYSNEVSITAPSNCTTTIPVNRSWTVVTTADAGFTASGPGPFTYNAAEVFQVSATGYQVFTYSFGIVPSSPTPARPVNIDLMNIQEQCGLVSVNFQGGTRDVGNGVGSWDAVNKKITIKWQTASTYQPFKATSVFTLNASDPIPDVPNLSAYIYSPTEVLINWSNVAFETQYKVYRATALAGPYTLLTTQNYPTTFFIDKNLTPSTTYYYKVTALNAAGESAQSAAASVTPGTTLFRPVENSIQQNFENQQGVSWADLDGDGDEDIVSPSFTNSNGVSVPPVLYENTGGGQFTRRDLAIIANENTAVTRGMGVFDFNNDGKLDLFVTKSTVTEPDYMLINNGAWDFTKVQVTNSVATFDAAFRSLGITDYDRDGFADILVTPDTNTTPIPSPILLKNNGGNTLTTVTGQPLVTTPINARTVNFADFDNDGDQDLFASNSNFGTTPNVLYKNNGDGTFSKVTGTALDSDLMTNTRTSSWGDIDNDGDMDLYVGNTGTTPDAIYRNNGSGGFSLVTGPFQETTGTYGSAFGDIDNDGDLDLIVINNVDNSIFINGGTGTFTKYTGLELMTHPSLFEIGGAFGDFDKDGFLDFIAGKGSTTDVNIPNLLYRNTGTASASKNWVQFKLVGTVSNKAAIGARVKVVTAARTMIREVQSLTGYGSSNSLIVHFGLGASTTITSVEVSWPNGKKQTYTNVPINQFVTLTEDATPPAITLTPSNGATNVSTATKLTMALSEAATPVAGKFIDVFKSTDLVNAVFHINASALVLDGTNTYSTTLASKLDLNTTYQVSIEAGAFTDAAANASVAVPAWTFTTSAGPQVTTLNPANGAGTIAVGTNLEITFNGNVTAVAGKKLKVMNGANTLIDITVSTTGTIAGNKYTLPSQLTLPYLTQLEVLVDPGAFVDVDQNNFKGIASGEWKFTTIEQPDNTKPVITYNASQLNLLEKGFLPVNVSITATDNIAVTTVTFYWRKGTDLNFQAVAATGNGPYLVTVPNTFADEMGFEYYIEASDAKSNVARSPLTGFYKSRISYTTAANKPTLTLPTAGTKASWQIITIPYDVPVSQVSQLFSTLGSQSSKTWRLLQYFKNTSNKDEWKEYPAIVNFERGKGYFVNTKLAEDKAKVTIENASAPDYSRSNLYKMDLKQGWNQIGNPYLVNINWNDVRAYSAATATVGELFLYTDGAYVKDPLLPTGKGGFVFANADVTGLPISFPGQTQASGRTHEFTFGNLDSDSWLIDLNVNGTDIRSNAGGVGMHPLASDQYDQFDGFNPPRFGDFAEVNFRHPEHFYGKFAKDVVTTKNDQVWSFEVDTNVDGISTLEWDNSKIQGSSRELYLYDVERQVPIDMTSSTSYSFISQSGNKFRVYYGTNVLEKIKPLKVLLGEAFPNPATGKATIPFSLPEKNGTFSVRVEIFDMMGRRVSTVFNGELPSGFYNKDWHGTENGTPEGIYIYRLSVGNDGKNESLSGKVILKN